MNFRHLLEKHQLATGILENINNYLRDQDISLSQGTMVHAPSSTKNKEGKRDLKKHLTKKGNQYFFGMKAHIGADAESGVVHRIHGTAANVADVTEVAHLLHGDENIICADAGYTGVEKRPEHEGPVMIAARRSTCKHLNKRSVLYIGRGKIEEVKAHNQAKVKHPFRVIKRTFGYVKTRFRSLVKNTAQLTTLFALSNLWMVRRQLLAGGGGTPVRANNQGFCLAYSITKG